MGRLDIELCGAERKAACTAQAHAVREGGQHAVREGEQRAVREGEQCAVREGQQCAVRERESSAVREGEHAVREGEQCSEGGRAACTAINHTRTGMDMCPLQPALGSTAWLPCSHTRVLGGTREREGAMHHSV